MTESSQTSPGPKAYELAWQKAGGKATGVSKNAVRAMAKVDQAPETAARVESGEIRKTAEALRQAEAEITGAR